MTSEVLEYEADSNPKVQQIVDVLRSKILAERYVQTGSSSPPPLFEAVKFRQDWDTDKYKIAVRLGEVEYLCVTVRELTKSSGESLEVGVEGTHEKEKEEKETEGRNVQVPCADMSVIDINCGKTAESVWSPFRLKPADYGPIFTK